MAPGTVALDAPVLRNGRPDWWLAQLPGDFMLAVFCDDPRDADRGALEDLARDDVPVRTILVRGAESPPGAHEDGIAQVVDAEGWLARRYDGRPGTCYLIRPDQHVAARWRRFEPRRVRAARDCALARGDAHDFPASGARA